MDSVILYHMCKKWYDVRFWSKHVQTDGFNISSECICFMKNTFKWKYSFAINGLLWKSNLSSTFWTNERAHAFLMANTYTVIYMRIYKNAIECQRIVSAKSPNARHFPRFWVEGTFACSQHRQFACVFVKRFRRVKFIDFSFFAHRHFVLTTWALSLSHHSSLDSISSCLFILVCALHSYDIRAALQFRHLVSLTTCLRQ